MFPVVFILCFVTFSSVNGGSPDISLYASEAKKKANVVLTCLATGFYPKDITMNIRRDGRILTKDDGVVSSGVQPNEYDTHQRRDHVEIPRADVATYTCEIIHPGSKMHVEKPWDKHSLTYIYTAFSHPVKLPGIHEFTAMGLLDNRMIDYYDSTVQKKIPKQKWMEERLQQEYWDKGTQSRQSKQQWLKVNIDILINRMRQNSNDTHVLQRMVGCVGKEDDNGNIQFVRGMDMHNYDGDDFLAFDAEHQVWVAAVDAAVPTKRKWDDYTALNDYTKVYLKRDCMEWMKTFLKYSTEQEQAVHNAKPPEVFMFATPAKKKSNMVLTCFATGFLPKGMTMEIKRDGRVLSKDDGLVSSGVRPNEDETFQRRDHVEILKADSAAYTCRVVHKANNVDVETAWDHQLPDNDAKGIIIGAAAGVVVLIAVVIVAVVIVMLKKKKAAKRKSYSSSRSAISTGSQDSNQPLMNSTGEIPFGNSQTSNDCSEENIELLVMNNTDSLNTGDSISSTKPDEDSQSASSSVVS